MSRLRVKTTYEEEDYGQVTKHTLKNNLFAAMNRLYAPFKPGQFRDPEQGVEHYSEI